MLTTAKGYWRTVRQYAAAPKTRYEYGRYALFLVLYAAAVGIVWGGIYLYYGNY
ncbi:hypothetical protein [uncultured Megasphaera sp.]|uniref:hypothetical protein n=1 Tax=uncultured Megasphaera sp. TaxID=165188 RepID=UPI0026587DE0|nr:hypothetical protein [uncultured Megasphaera sp.]